MIRRLFALGAALTLAGCVDVSFSSHNVESHVHRTMPAAGIRSVHVENVSGSIAVTGWNRPEVDVRALEYGADQDAINRTRVEVTRSGDQISINTRYSTSGGFFGNHNGAAVDYVIHAPSSVTLSVANVSGSTDLVSLNGDVSATEVSGRMTATLGRLGGAQNVSMSAISGPITLRIARNSDTRIDASSISGGVSLFFPADIHRGVVGSSVTGALGKGSSSVTLHTVSGSITVNPQ